ncbi:transposase [Nostoc punctiforme]|uniref:RNA-guided endonuclease InsQ/TnpB family protein n=1 Tax=Nostoc punctiforme TaxID=272131 RepID=UPI001F554769|nr:transposase [Nostoc punctiforme]
MVNSYDLIVFENLNIRGLARTRLAKSILDVAWGAFLQIIEAVAVRRGKHTAGVDPRGTSINCSGCGERVEKTLAVRVHSCSCGLVIDRDWNSALNLLKRGSVGLPMESLWRLGQWSARETESILCEFEMLPLTAFQLAVRVVTSLSS